MFFPYVQIFYESLGYSSLFPDIHTLPICYCCSLFQLYSKVSKQQLCQTNYFYGDQLNLFVVLLPWDLISYFSDALDFFSWTRVTGWIIWFFILYSGFFSIKSSYWGIGFYAVTLCICACNISMTPRSLSWLTWWHSAQRKPCLRGHLISYINRKLNSAMIMKERYYHETLKRTPARQTS